MRAIGFNAGQFGDVIMGTVAARAHKLAFPDSKLTCGIAEKYGSIFPLFENNDYFDDTYIWKGYNDWPAVEDSLFLSRMRFDKVYNAMPQHTDPFWYLRRHQTAEMCLMHGLTPPENLQVSLTKVWPREPNQSIALSLRGETRGSEKNVTEQQAKQIVELIKGCGLNPVQIGHHSESQYCDDRFIGTFEESVRFMLNCFGLVTVDTAMAWIASGYSFPTVGLYGYSYYPLAKTAKNWQPVNPNAIYVESENVSDIIPERIEEAIKSIL